MSSQEPKYPLLESLLSEKGMRLKGAYTTRDVAEIFSVSVRTIQDRVRQGQLTTRNLPGRTKYLSADLEEFLKNSCVEPALLTRK